MNVTTPNQNLKAIAGMVITILILSGVIFGLHWLLTDQFHQNAIAAERKIPRMVLPKGDTFDLYQGTLVDKVSACYVASNDAGIAVVADQTISHGDIQVMVGLNSEGQVTDVAILSQDYVEGSDAGISDPNYLSIYIGRTVLSASDITKDYEIDPVPGAEEASDAVYQSVKIAFLQQEVLDDENDAAAKKAEDKGEN